MGIEGRSLLSWAKAMSKGSGLTACGKYMSCECFPNISWPTCKFLIEQIPTEKKVCGKSRGEKTNDESRAKRVMASNMF